MPDPLGVAAWHASEDDLDTLVALYRALEAEQVELKSMWPLADGLPEPIDAAFKELMAAEAVTVYLGGIEGVPVGFLVTRIEPLLPQAEGEVVGVISHVFTDHDARGVGVGEAMLDAALTELRAKGLKLFDARVLPGHRIAKNFFEAAGFSARLIVMHHEDDDEL